MLEQPVCQWRQVAAASTQLRHARQLRRLAEPDVLMRGQNYRARQSLPIHQRPT